MRSAGTFKILANRDIREAVKQTTVPTTQSEDLESRSTASVEPPRKKRKHNADLVTYTRETVPPELLKCACPHSLSTDHELTLVQTGIKGTSCSLASTRAFRWTRKDGGR